MKDGAPTPAPWRDYRFDCDPYVILLRADPSLSERDVRTIADQLAHRNDGPSIWHETRGVIIPCDSLQPHDGIKIKGAGYKKGPVRFGTPHDHAYMLPRYDFEGNYAPDIAKAHERPHSGGMSYQQALHEVRVSQHVLERGMRTYPPLGYGSIAFEGMRSWFCLLNVPYRAEFGWSTLIRRPGQRRRSVARLARTQIKLHRLGVYLTLWGAAEVDGKFIRKDFHTAHLASPNDSFLARFCYFAFDVNFALYMLNHPFWIGKMREPDPQEVTLIYLRELTGIDCEAAQVEPFRVLLRDLKENATLDADARVARIRADPLGAALLDTFMSDEDRAFFASPQGSTMSVCSMAMPKPSSPT